MRNGSDTMSIWAFAPMAYGPTLLFALGEGAVLPLLPVLATSMGANLATSSLVLAALVVGQLAGNLPAGWLVSRVGERITMLVAGSLALATCVLLLFATSLWMLNLAAFLVGICASAFALARHAFMTTRVPLAFRARALSLLGGSFRLGAFVGPFISAGLLAWFGTEHASLVFFAICALGATLLVTFGTDPEDAMRKVDAAAAGVDVSDLPKPPPGPGVFSTMWLHRGVLARVGLAAASLSGVRSARQAILPLWGIAIGMDAQSIAVVVGISGGVDFLLFYSSGQVMDRFGRLWAIVPAMTLMGGGLIALACTYSLASSGFWFTALAVVLGVGNGLSSGTLLTLGADLAPPEQPAAFLGSWRTLTDAGGASAPLLISALTALVSLPLAAAVVGVLALVGAGGFLRWVPKYVPRTR